MLAVDPPALTTREMDSKDVLTREGSLTDSALAFGFDVSIFLPASPDLNANNAITSRMTALLT